MSLRAKNILYIILLILFSSCSVNRFIPENKYLLDEVKIESDTKLVDPSQFSTYVRQNPNARWFNLVKVPMRIYCISGRDSTKWINRFFQKIGDAPEIYNDESAQKSKVEIQKAVQNMGFMTAQVSLDKEIKHNKLKLKYKIKAGKPYMVRNIQYDVDDLTIMGFIQEDSVHSLLHEGMPFDVNTLDAERQRIAKILMSNGYFKFNKDFIVYQADTTRNTYLVDLTLRILPYQRQKEDTPTKHQQFKIHEVNFISDNNVVNADDLGLGEFNEMNYKDFPMYYKDNLFLRPKVMLEFNRIRPQALYNDQDVQETHSLLGRLKALRYSNINFKEVTVNDSTQLDAFISLAKGKDKSVSFEIEGTNSAGDLGAAASVSFQHRNVFKGSETFTFKVRGAYEAITGSNNQDYVNKNYTEFGVETSLNFPQFMFPFLSSDFKRRVRATSEVGLQYSQQIRPEFSRTLAAASWSYKWSSQRHQYKFDLLDINYVYMPRKSQEFQDYLDQMSARNSLLRASYEDQLIVKLGYTYTYYSAGNTMMRTLNRDSYSIRFNIEESGNLLYGAFKAASANKRHDKGFVIANIPFAQYVKGDFDYTRNIQIDNRNALVFHFGTGIAYPYGNSKILPFEKRYFSGGANSVRGWSIRSLGPGGYKGNEEGKMDFIKQSGDIKLDMNLEYRTHLFWKLNGAAFVDAGNIWTIRSDVEQEDGLFKFNRFYKQIAVAYGLGIRFDLDYLILRFDGGMKAVNPMYSGRDKYPIAHPKLSRDFAFHFAVGYPF